MQLPPSPTPEPHLGIRIALLGATWLLAGCAAVATVADPTSQLNAVTPPQTTDDLLRQLSGAVSQVRAGDEPAPAWQQAVGQTLWIGDEQLWVYQAAGVDEAALDELRQGNADRKLWQTDSLVVAYDGYNGGVILVLSGLLGDPLQPQAPAQDEPYPPAVVAALEMAAKQAGVPPQAVTISTFEPVEWADGCLGLPPEAGACSGDGGPGWLIHASIEGQAIEIHTDALADNVRFREGSEQ